MTQQTATQRKRGLGRGLGAIFQDTAVEDVSAPTVASISAVASEASEGAVRPDGMRMLAVSDLTPGVYQPRRHFDEASLSDLAASIRTKGVLEPLIVRSQGDGAAGGAARGKYEIIAGERRWRAAQMAQLHEVPVLVKSLSDAEALEIALIENIQREDLTPLEEARAYEQLISQFSYTQEQLAGALGRSRSHVANMMRLLKLPDDVQAMVGDGKLTAGHARALLATEAPKRLAEDIVRRGLNVRQTEKLVADVAKGGGRQRRPSTGVAQEKDADTRAMEHALMDALGLTVSIAHRANGSGDVIISYSDVEQLDDIARRLQG